MCNLFNQTTAREAMRGLFPDRPVMDQLGNLGPADVYPDRLGAVARVDGGTVVMQMARWGLPSPPQYHSASGIDRGVTNVLNTGSTHWRRWLGSAHRCLVPFDRFAEPRGAGRGNAWFGLTGNSPGFFAGIMVPGWTSIRKLKDGETTDDLFAFLTCDPNGVVGAIHPKAMPVVLVEPADCNAWLQAPWAEAKALQRPVADEQVELIEDVR